MGYSGRQSYLRLQTVRVTVTTMTLFRASDWRFCESPCDCPADCQTVAGPRYVRVTRRHCRSPVRPPGLTASGSSRKLQGRQRISTPNWNRTHIQNCPRLNPGTKATFSVGICSVTHSSAQQFVHSWSQSSHSRTGTEVTGFRGIFLPRPPLRPNITASNFKTWIPSPSLGLQWRKSYGPSIKLHSRVFETDS